MIWTEYNEEEVYRLMRRDAKEEGREEGRAEGRAEGEAKGEAKILKRLKELGNSVKQLSEMFSIPESTVEQYLAMDV